MSAAPGESAAGWSPTTITVRSTSNLIRELTASSDGASGSFVAWFEEATPGAGGVLLAHHLFAGEVLDPLWPAAGAVACGTVQTRADLVCVPDGLTGLYLLWRAGGTLFVTRLDGTGRTAEGWSECGTSLGNEYGSCAVVADGENGIFVAWPSCCTDGDLIPVVLRIGPGFTVPGWEGGPRPLHPPDPVPTEERWLRLASAPDGGAYAAWATTSLDTTAVQSGVHVTRIQPNGDVAAGWPAAGVAFGSLHENLLYPGRTPTIDLSADGRGGVFLASERQWRSSSNDYLEVRLRRLDPTGASAPGWPSEGRLVEPQQFMPFGLIDEAPHLLNDGSQDVFLGIPSYASESYMATDYTRWTDTGPVGYAGTADPLDGKSVIAGGAGGLAIATFKPSGPTGPFQLAAKLSVKQSSPPFGWTDILESHPESSIHWYSGVALAPVGSGGLAFFWAQTHDLFGIFARRFTPFGPLLDVDHAGAAGYALAELRYVPGAGVSMQVQVPRGEPARVELHDVEGRRVAARRLAPVDALARTVQFGEGDHLPSGIYFVRIIGASGMARGRVAIVR